MAQAKYTIAFHGRIAAGRDLERVKASLGKLIKKDARTVDTLFSGRRVILKKNVNHQAAETFKAAFEQTGALCDIEQTEALSALPRLEMEKKESTPDDNDKSHQPLSACPHCGHEQALENECQQCGVLFNKLYQKPAEPASPEAKQPPLSDEMKEGIARAKMIGLMSATATKKRRNLRKIFKLTRIGLLLSVLVVIAAYTTCTHARIAGWKEPLDVVIYPINGDDTVETEAFIQVLDAEDFSAIETFMSEEAASYDLPLNQPVIVHFAQEIETLPPEIPANRNPVSVAIWSLKLRYWAFKHNPHEGPSDIRIYVVFKAMGNNAGRMEESFGLRKGLMGIVNTAPGDKYRDGTNIVVTHEVLHTLGATDKYSVETLAPLYPDGYAQPDKSPRHPQLRGEIMAVRIPLSEETFTMPSTLDQVIIGEKTCMEIKWCQQEEE